MRSREAATEDLRLVREVSEGPAVIDLRDAGERNGTARQRPRDLTGGSPVLELYRRIGFLLVAIDCVAVVLALIAAYLLRFGYVPGGFGFHVVLACILWAGVFRVSGLYSPQHLSDLEEFRRTIAASAMGIVLIIVLTFWLDVYVSRSWMAISLLLAVGLELLGRRAVRELVTKLRTSGALAYWTLLIGKSEDCARIGTMFESPGSGFRQVGSLEMEGRGMHDRSSTAASFVEEVRSEIRDHQADCVFIASPDIEGGDILAIRQAARLENAEVRLYTHLSDILVSRLSVQAMGSDATTLTIKPMALSPVQSLLKRSIDVGLAALGVILFSPLLLLVAGVIRLTSRGPILFKQYRVTDGGRPFQMLKFRTMRVDGDRLLREGGMDTSAPFFKMKQDPRLTRVGGFLRKWSLDELPQLFNVIKGDMSLVGPRPLPADQVSANLELLGPRHEVRSGVTGWWQIQGRSDVDPEAAVRLDLFYIENWSPALDAYILMRTLGALVRRQGAY